VISAGNALGNAGREADPCIRGFEHGVRRTGRRNEDHRRIGPGFRDGFANRIEDGNPVDHLPALAGCDATDDRRSVFDREFRVKPAHSAEALHEKLG
jgi:hypothetical protein